VEKTVSHEGADHSIRHTGEWGASGEWGKMIEEKWVNYSSCCGN